MTSQTGWDIAHLSIVNHAHGRPVYPCLRRRPHAQDHGGDTRSRPHGRIYAAPSSHRGPHHEAARTGFHALLDDDAERSQ